jgi:hypothetical protein
MLIIVQYVNKIVKLNMNKLDFSNHTAVKMGGWVCQQKRATRIEGRGLLYLPAAHWSRSLKKVLGI